ncbi:hypothetical protein Plhal304r1_c092g0172581 [Plasmopara halstedii]
MAMAMAMELELELGCMTVLGCMAKVTAMVELGLDCAVRVMAMVELGLECVSELECWPQPGWYVAGGYSSSNVTEA